MHTEGGYQFPAKELSHCRPGGIRGGDDGLAFVAISQYFLNVRISLDLFGGFGYNRLTLSQIRPTDFDSGKGTCFYAGSC